MSADEFDTALDYLLRSLEGRVDPAHLEQYKEYRDVGEEVLAIDSIAGAIDRGKIPVSREEYEKLEYLLHEIGQPTRWEPNIQRRDEILASLNVVEEGDV